MECHTAVDPGSFVVNGCGSELSESCWGGMEGIDEDEDVGGTLPPTVSHAVPGNWAPHRLSCVRLGTHMTW